MAPGTAEEPLSGIDKHLLYIGSVPARTGRPNCYRNRSNEVGGAATPFRWKATSHPHADQQTAGARRHRGIAAQHLQAMVNGDWSSTLPSSMLWQRSLMVGPLNILETVTRKPTCFGLLDFTAGYHQTPLDPASQALTALRAADGLYQWATSPYF